MVVPAANGLTPGIVRAAGGGGEMREEETFELEAAADDPRVTGRVDISETRFTTATIYHRFG